jgi:hypothetical protein
VISSDCKVALTPIPSATIAFSTNQYHLLPSTSILCILSAIPQARNNNIKIHSDDLRVYNTLEESFVKLKAAMKLFVKRGMSKIVQEVELNEGMESSFE